MRKGTKGTIQNASLLNGWLHQRDIPGNVILVSGNSLGKGFSPTGQENLYRQKQTNRYDVMLKYTIDSV